MYRYNSSHKRGKKKKKIYPSAVLAFMQDIFPFFFMVIFICLRFIFFFFNILNLHHLKVQSLIAVSGFEIISKENHKNLQKIKSSHDLFSFQLHLFFFIYDDSFFSIYSFFPDILHLRHLRIKPVKHPTSNRVILYEDHLNLWKTKPFEDESGYGSTKYHRLRIRSLLKRLQSKNN